MNIFEIREYSCKMSLTFFGMVQNNILYYVNIFLHCIHISLKYHEHFPETGEHFFFLNGTIHFLIYEKKRCIIIFEKSKEYFFKV